MSAMTEISYLWPLTGGLLIGLSAGLYLLLNGRIAGISGFAAAAAGLTDYGGCKLALGFLAGVIAGASLAAALIRQTEIVITSSPALLIAAGLIVGYGTGSDPVARVATASAALRGFRRDPLPPPPSSSALRPRRSSSPAISLEFSHDALLVSDRLRAHLRGGSGNLRYDQSRTSAGVPRCRG